MHTCMHAYMHVCIHACMHTYIYMYEFVGEVLIFEYRGHARLGRPNCPKQTTSRSSQLAYERVCRRDFDSAAFPRLAGEPIVHGLVEYRLKVLPRLRLPAAPPRLKTEISCIAAKGMLICIHWKCSRAGRASAQPVKHEATRAGCFESGPAAMQAARLRATLASAWQARSTCWQAQARKN